MDIGMRVKSGAFDFAKSSGLGVYGHSASEIGFAYFPIHSTSTGIFKALQFITLSPMKALKVFSCFAPCGIFAVILSPEYPPKVDAVFP